MEGKFGGGEGGGEFGDIGVGEIKFGESYPLCLISFIVLERQLSSLEAVSFTSRLDF